jgi:hypothetical protein
MLNPRSRMNPELCPAMTVTCLPLSSPLPRSRRLEPRMRGRVRRVAYYGPLAITYDCEDNPTDGESERDLLEVAFVPNDWTDGWPKVKNADQLLEQALAAIQAALHISADELIENAPRREDAEG